MKKIAILLFISGLVSCSNDNMKEFYSNGNIKEEITMEKGIRNGPAKSFYEDGKLQSEGAYINGTLEGDFIKYFSDGKIESKALFKKGKTDGLYMEYYQDGHIKAEANFKDGKQDGITKNYYENGKLQSKLNFTNGERDGAFIFYYPDGKIKNDAFMESGINTYYQEYDSLGNKGDDHREIRAEIPSKNIKLGEPFTAKLKLTGPLEGIIINGFKGEAESISQLKTMNSAPNMPTYCAASTDCNRH